MGHTEKRKRPRNRSCDSRDGIEFVRCRICGDYRRVINGQHLSKHDTDRDTYMEEYHLIPDAKDFRMIQKNPKYLKFRKFQDLDFTVEVVSIFNSVLKGNSCKEFLDNTRVLLKWSDGLAGTFWHASCGTSGTKE